MLAQLHGNFPADGKMWKSRVSARMNGSMFSPWCGNVHGVRAMGGLELGWGWCQECDKDRDGARGVTRTGMVPGMQAMICGIQVLQL